VLAQQLGVVRNPAELLDEAVGVAEFPAEVALDPMVVECGGALPAYEGASAPEVVPGDVRDGYRRAQVVEVVGRALLGDRDAREGGDGVEVGAALGGGQVGVAADGASGAAQECG